MLQLKKIFYLLNQKEKRHFYFLIFFMMINSAFEVLGITAIIPIISITINSDLSFFEGMFFFDTLQKFSLNFIKNRLRIINIYNVFFLIISINLELSLIKCFTFLKPLA